MNSKTFMTILITGILLSLASFSIRTSSNIQLACVYGTKPLDELSAGSRKVRGFPFHFYVERVPDNCTTEYLGTSIAADGPVNSEFKIMNLAYNTLVWILLSGIAVVGYSKFRNHNG